MRKGTEILESLARVSTQYLSLSFTFALLYGSRQCWSYKLAVSSPGPPSFLKRKLRQEKEEWTFYFLFTSCLFPGPISVLAAMLQLQQENIPVEALKASSPQPPTLAKPVLPYCQVPRKVLAWAGSWLPLRDSLTLAPWIPSSKDTTQLSSTLPSTIWTNLC